jgi:hypothetical protein
MLFVQTTGSRLADRKIAQFDKNTTKGVLLLKQLRKQLIILLGLFLFVVVVSCKSFCF